MGVSCGGELVDLSIRTKTGCRSLRADQTVAEYSIPSSENEEGGCSYYAVLVAAKGVQCMI